MKPFEAITFLPTNDKNIQDKWNVWVLKGLCLFEYNNNSSSSKKQVVSAAAAALRERRWAIHFLHHCRLREPSKILVYPQTSYFILRY